MTKIVHARRARSARVIWLLEELSVPYQLETIEFTREVLQSPAYLQLHPLGKVPVVQDGSVTLYESGAIVEYLLEKYGKGVCSTSDSGATVLSCGMPNAGPQHWVEDTAMSAMHAWTKDGQSPAIGAPLTFATGGNALARDAYGIALGGVRTPAVDIPIATYSGQPASGSSIVCSVFGQTIPFTAAQLTTLYPTHDDYVSKITAAATQDEHAGFLLATDLPLIEQEAQSAPVPQ